MNLSRNKIEEGGKEKKGNWGEKVFSQAAIAEKEARGEEERAYLVESEAVEMNAHDLLDARAGDLDRLLQALEHTFRVSEQFLVKPQDKES
jgi:hypothetical protein